MNFYFYADDTQLYVHLSHMNASAAFDKLNRCLQDVKEWMSAGKLKLSLQDVKEWMSAGKLKLNSDKTEFILFGSKIYLFIYLGFYVAFNTVQVISRRVVGMAEETSTYSLLGFCTVNCQPTASNYQLSHLRPCQESNPGLRGGRRECYHSATMVPFWLQEAERKVKCMFPNRHLGQPPSPHRVRQEPGCVV